MLRMHMRCHMRLHGPHAVTIELCHSLGKCVALQGPGALAGLLRLLLDNMHGGPSNNMVPRYLPN